MWLPLKDYSGSLEHIPDKDSPTGLRAMRNRYKLSEVSSSAVISNKSRLNESSGTETNLQSQGV